MIDWQLLILLFRKHNVSVSRLRRELGINYDHLSHIARGEVKEPRFNTGVKLLDYAYEVIPEQDFIKVKM